MSRFPSLTTFAATLLAGFALVVAILLGPDAAFADDTGAGYRHSGWTVRTARQPLDPRWLLDEADETATLAAVQTTLSEVADGSTYVWYRANGRVSGQFKPTASFRDASGKVCRHLEITLIAGHVTRAREGIACRLSGGIWSLEG